jgi:cysteinyl-tRNA synthetase
MSIRLFNTRTHSTEEFRPLHDGEVRIYVCGLTPSAEAHLGHARSFMFFDVLRRYLVHRGYRVTFVQNVTDIDDRSIARGLETGELWSTIVEGYYASFKRSMRRLNVLEPDHEPRATGYIPEILAMVAELIEAGHAYVVEDGVYYAVRSFERYGALSGRNIEELQIGARIAPGESKRDALDFALWKFAKPGEPSWPSPWGEGRPGWHIECSAMARALLGAPFDIHGGGYDLIFPHHENEIAQSEPLMPLAIRREEDVEIARQLRAALATPGSPRCAGDSPRLFADGLSEADELHRIGDLRRDDRAGASL